MPVLYKLSESYSQVIEMADQLDDGTLKDTLDSIEEAFDKTGTSNAKQCEINEGLSPRTNGRDWKT